MNIKQIVIACILFQLFSIASIAQDRGSKVESIKIAYLSERLNLDPRTAEKFWPIYNQYDDEMRRVVQESKRANDTRTAEEILDQEQKAIDIKRKYSTAFLKVISNEQLTALFKAEKEFTRMLLRRMNKSENRQQGQDNQPRNNGARHQDRTESTPRQQRTEPQPADAPAMRRSR